MNSFTSSFNSEFKVLAAVLLVLVSAEAVMRVMEESLSVDVRHIREIPRIAQALAEKERPRVLFLGNSLTRNAVDEAILTTEIGNLGVRPLSVAKVVPDASGISIWYYEFKKSFIDANRKPDVVVVHFGARHLRDGDRRQVAPNLGGYHAALRDLPEVFGDEVRIFGDRLEFLLSMGSTAFANRTRVAPRILDLLIPYYRPNTERINAAIRQSARRTEPPLPTYQRLERFLKLAADHDVTVIAVAIPLANRYDLDPQIQATIESFGMIFIDNREVQGMTASSYSDGYHMNEQGKDIYSRHLAWNLAGPLKTPLQTPEVVQLPPPVE
jgi:hypothetical protein